VRERGKRERRREMLESTHIKSEQFLGRDSWR
jgi:hypothetical protein